MPKPDDGYEHIDELEAAAGIESIYSEPNPDTNKEAAELPTNDVEPEVEESQPYDAPDDELSPDEQAGDSDRESRENGFGDDEEDPHLQSADPDE